MFCLGFLSSVPPGGRFTAVTGAWQMEAQQGHCLSLLPRLGDKKMALHQPGFPPASAG